MPPRKRHPTTTGRGSTYRERKSVQTKPATSHYAAAIYGGSFDRKARAEQLLAGKTRVSVEDLQALLADRQGYPGSINRYPGLDPRTGFQRSVVSVIVEPAAGRMHVTRGNPGDMPYEVYRLD